jgi:hypothetical protein
MSFEGRELRTEFGDGSGVVSADGTALARQIRQQSWIVAFDSSNAE